MGIIVTTTGNGKFTPNEQSDVIIEYSTSESATPLSLADTSGEIPALSVTGMLNSVNSIANTHPNSKLLVDNQLTLTDTIRGTFTGRVSTLSMDSQSVTVEVLSLFEKLNAVKKTQSVNGTVASAVQSYMATAGISPSNYSIDSSFNSIPAVFPGWNDNLWNGLKMLCVAVNAEMYFQNNILYFKPRATKTMMVENIDAESYSVQLGQQAKSTIFTRSKTTWVSNAIVYAYGAQDSTESIDVGELKEIVLTSKVALNSINQPNYSANLPSNYVDFIQPSSLGTVPSANPNGFYVFRDKSGIIVSSQRLALSGASLKVELTDNPYEIKLIITGPSLPNSTPWTLDYQDNSPAIALTGTGVLVQSETRTFNTGAAIGDDTNEYSDNPFLINENFLTNTAYYTNQESCGPVVEFSFATDKIVEANNQEFGYLPGAIFSYGGSKYRVVSASYGYDKIDIVSKQYVTFADFNTLWAGKTFAQFNSTMLDPMTYPDEYMKYSDLAIIPLMEPTA